MKKILRYFTPFEWSLIAVSYAVILLTFLIFDRTNYFNFVSALIGIAALIFSAKGNPTGPLLMILFSLGYGVISFSFRYYGEMITYLGMSLPMSVWAFIAWFRNPSDRGHAEVKVSSVKGREWWLLLLYTAIITLVFYFLLSKLDTPNILPSTFSVSTSFAAAYLTARRSPYFALAYAANDVVLIVLWILATLRDIGYLSVTVCFAVFLANDLYSFFNWRRMANRQSTARQM